jgi:hypothetical protein
MTLTHTTPTDTTGSFGVVDLRGDGISAYCENVTVAVGTGGFSGTAVSAGFAVDNSNGRTGITKLSLSRCSVLYGGNGTGVYPSYLVGYRMTDACLEMEDCDSTYVPGAPNGNGYSVTAATTQANPEQSFLRIVGGKFKSLFGSVYWTATAADYPVWISGTHIKSNVNAGGGGIYIEKRARANIDSVYVESPSSPCVYFDATGGYDSFNVGTLSHSTLLSVNSQAWNSVGAPASGYHTIIGNTYRSLVAPTSGANDEVAHNIAIP